MDIESKLKREGGSRVQLGATEYHFAPGDDGAHVAQVDDDEHVATLLAIPEGFRIYKPAGWPAASSESVEPIEPEQPIDTDDAAAEIAALRADLAVQFEAKFGKKPHYNLSIDKLRNALMSVQNDQG